MAFLILVCTPSLAFATALAVLGYWPPLPFAGAEVIALCGVFIALQQRGSSYQSVAVEDDAVVIESGRGGVCVQQRLPVYWARLELRPAQFRGHPTRLLIASRDKSVEIGSFLTEEERQSLARDLAQDLRDKAAFAPRLDGLVREHRASRASKK